MQPTACLCGSKKCKGTLGGSQEAFSQRCACCNAPAAMRLLTRMSTAAVLDLGCCCHYTAAAVAMLLLAQRSYC